VTPEDKTFGFRFVCKDFEIEIRGDQHFVDKLLGRYESRVMLKLKELMPHAPQPEPRPPQPQPRPQGLAPTPARPPEAAPPQPAGEKKGRRHRGRGRRGKHRPENLEAGGPRLEPEPALLNQTPLLRGQEAEPDEAAQPPLFPEPAPEFSEPAFIHPPLGDVRPAAADFPSRRRTPKVEKESLQSLLEQRRPRTHHDRIMLMGYHLENAAGGSDFTAEELMECYRAAGETPPANLTQVLGHATRSGFMIRHDQGRTQRFKLSARGRRYVEDGLKLL